MRSAINAAVAIQRPMLSDALIKALNAHAISCLHVKAGEYRPCAVQVGQIMPPDHYRVPELMADFINFINFHWLNSNVFALAAYTLWRFNVIHPFINGNGRTARALCYYVICAKSGGLLPGDTAVPELIRRNRAEYVTLLRVADLGFQSGDPNYLFQLQEFLKRLTEEQLQTAEEPEAVVDVPPDPPLLALPAPS